MRISFTHIMIALLMLLFATRVDAQVSPLNMFTMNLSLGSSGTQVIALQKILNRDSDTRITGTRLGSLGNETDHFGSLTRAAVVRFQEKYANEILTPVGLVRGNGRVGLYTRNKLNMLSTSVATTSVIISIAAPIVATSTPTTVSTMSPQTIQDTPPPIAIEPSPTIASQNPNLKNLDKILAVIDQVATKQGYSAASITIMKEQVAKSLATTTDLLTAFEEMVRNKPNKTAQDNSIIGKTLAMIGLTFNKVFGSEHAHAATGVPFGGAILGVIPCNGYAFNIVLTPLPPSFPVLLTYFTGSQAFLSYNIPFTTWLLGEYLPGGGGCMQGIWWLPSEGFITPVVGSSLL